MAMSRKLNKDEFEKELEKLDQIKQSKIVITLLQNQTNAEEILDLLKDYDEVDEVHVLLNDGETLRVCHNNRYWIRNEVYGFNSSSEYGTTYEEGDKSVPFTGAQLFKKQIQFLLDLK